MRNRIGDVDIFVKSDSWSYSDGLKEAHTSAFFIHLGTATKRFYMYAHESEDRNGTVRIYEIDERWGPTCQVGVYGTLHKEYRRKKLFVGIGYNERDLFWNQTGKLFSNAEIAIGVDKVAKTQKLKRVEIETLQYKGDPIRFACVTTESYVLHFDLFISTIAFLSLYFHSNSLVSTIHWFRQSNRTLCD